MVEGDCHLSYLGGRGSRIAGNQEVEVAVIRDHTTALQPWNQSQSTSISKKQKPKNKKL